MKLIKKDGKLIVQATADELRKNPKLAAAIKKAQLGGGTTVNPAEHGDSLGTGAELPTSGSDLGGPAEGPADGGVSDDLGGIDAPTDGSVDPDLAGDPTEKFTSAVDKAYQDAFGKPMDENTKTVLKGLAGLAQGEKSPAVDDLDSTDGQIPGGDLGSGSDHAGSPENIGADPSKGIGNNPPAPGASAGGIDPLAAMSRGRLTKVASADDFVRKLAAKLAK